MISCVALLLGTHHALSANQDKGVEEFFDKLRASYSSISSAKFQVAARHIETEKEFNYKIYVEFCAPNLVHVFWEGDGNYRTIVCDGKKIYWVPKLSKGVSEFNYEPDQLTVIIRNANLETSAYFDWNRQLSTNKDGAMKRSVLTLTKGVEWNGKKWFVLNRFLLRAAVSIDYYIDPDLLLIFRVVTYDTANKRLIGDFRVTSFKSGVKIDASRFKKPKPTK